MGHGHFLDSTEDKGNVKRQRRVLLPFVKIDMRQQDISSRAPRGGGGGVDARWGWGSVRRRRSKPGVRGSVWNHTATALRLLHTHRWDYSILGELLTADPILGVQLSPADLLVSRIISGAEGNEQENGPTPAGLGAE